MPTKTPSHNGIRALSSGFTLVEMAVVVVVMGILLTMGLRMTQATQNNAAWTETKLKQDRIKVALISFIRTNGRLPCPDAALPPTGAEPLPIGNCLVNAGRGVLPWRALGLSVNDVQDGWSNFFTYRVANRTPVSSNNWTLRTGVAPFRLTEFNNPLPPIALTIRERNDAGILSTLTTNAVVVIVSHGKNGLGARTLRGAAVSPLPGAGDELVNATAGTLTFTTRTPTDVAGANGAFDDVVTYMTPQDVLQPLVSEKSLFGSCQAYCSPPQSPPTVCTANNIPVGLVTIPNCAP